MADPNDLYAEQTPSGVPKDQFGTPQGAGGFNPNSTAEAAQAAATEAARVARSNSIAASGVGVGSTPPVTVVPNSAADEWNSHFVPGGEGYSLTPQQFNDAHPSPLYNRHGKRVNEDQPQFNDVRSTARDYHAATEDAVKQTLAAHKDISSADFVRKLAVLDSTHPDYPTQFAELVATHPTAGGKLVDQVIDHQQNRREVFQKAVEHGGAAEFGSKDTPTPAYSAYIDTFAKTKDPQQARAAAELTTKNEATLDEAARKGLITDADFPKWNDQWKLKGSTRPPVYNADGSTNYAAVKKIIAAREGAGQGLADQRKQVTEDRQLLSTLGPQLDNMQQNDPLRPALLQQYTDVVDRLNTHSQGLRTPGTPAAAPASAISNLLPPPRKPKS